MQHCVKWLDGWKARWHASGPLLRCVCVRALTVCLGVDAGATQWRARWHATGPLLHWCKSGPVACHLARHWVAAVSTPKQTVKPRTQKQRECGPPACHLVFRSSSNNLATAQEKVVEAAGNKSSSVALLMVVVVVARVVVVIVNIATRNASAVIVGDALLVIEVEVVAPAVVGARPIGTSHCQVVASMLVVVVADINVLY